MSWLSRLFGGSDVKQRAIVAITILRAKQVIPGYRYRGRKILAVRKGEYGLMKIETSHDTFVVDPDDILYLECDPNELAALNDIRNGLNNASN